MRRARHVWARLRHQRCMPGCDLWAHHPGVHVTYLPPAAFRRLLRELEDDDEWRRGDDGVWELEGGG